jgi:ABC-type lipopolysaccharide export system ATPase subunit
VILSVKDLPKRHGSDVVVDNVSLDVKSGDVVGVLEGLATAAYANATNGDAQRWLG